MHDESIVETRNERLSLLSEDLTRLIIACVPSDWVKNPESYVGPLTRSEHVGF